MLCGHLTFDYENLWERVSKGHAVNMIILWCYAHFILIKNRACAHDVLYTFIRLAVKCRISIVTYFLIRLLFVVFSGCGRMPVLTAYFPVLA